MQNYDLEKYDFSRNIILAWPVGVGKTYTAQKLLSKKPRENILSVYQITDAHFKQLVKSNQLVLRKPEDYGTGLEYYPLEMMRRCEVLLYDDIGVSDTSDAYIRDLTYVLDERTNKKLPIIFTTNLKEKELTEKLHERIVSRMMMNCDVIAMTGEDRRKKTSKFYQITSAVWNTD